MQTQLESEKKANEFKKLLNLTKPGTSFDSNLQRSVEFADDKAYEDQQNIGQHLITFAEQMPGPDGLGRKRSTVSTQQAHEDQLGVL